jgi:hypothetical protein
LQWLEVLDLAFMKVRLCTPWVEANIKNLVNLFRDSRPWSKRVLLFFVRHQPFKVFVVHAIIFIPMVLFDDV